MGRCSSERRDSHYSEYLKHFPVEVKETAEKGKAVFSTRELRRDEIILSEVPLQSMQSLQNRQDVLTCSHCFRFIGSLELHADLAAQRCSRAALHEPSWKLPVPNVNSISAQLTETLVECPNGCGELYCSRECQIAESKHSHRLLCVGPCDELEPLVKFKFHAIQTNEIFIVASRVIAHVLSRFESIWKKKTSQKEELHVEQVLNEAWEPYSRFVQLPWWTVVCPSANIMNNTDFEETGNNSESNSHEQAETASSDDSLGSVLLQLVSESSKLLADALLPEEGLDSPLSRLTIQLSKSNQVKLRNSLFSIDRFSRIIGMFEQNQLAFEIPSPLVTFFDECQQNNGDIFRDAIAVMQPLIKEIQRVYVSDSCGNDDNNCNYDDDSSNVDENDNDISNDDNNCNYDDDSSNVDKNDNDISNDDNNCNYDDDSSDVDENDNDIGPNHYFPSLYGTSLFTLICCMNHSCRPNVEIIYNTNIDGPLKASVKVIVDKLEIGEELCFSYIDTSLPVDERRQALLDYGFSCVCEKCVEESNVE